MFLAYREYNFRIMTDYPRCIYVKLTLLSTHWYDQYILGTFSEDKVSSVEILYREINVIDRNFFERSDPL